MPDSLLSPGGGLESFDERDLDDVLAGKTADLPDGLRPIADFLAALGAGPAPAELSGEATAMAQFRALGLGQVDRPAGQAATLLLEAPPGGQRAARPSRRHGRHRARPERRGALRPAVLLSAAAAAVIVLVVLVTGNLVGFFGNTTHVAGPSAATSSAAVTPGHSAAPREESTSAAKEPTASPTATYSTTPAQSLASTTCWDYYSAYQNQGLAPWVTQQSLWELLTKLAGSKSRIKVFQFCAPYVQGLFPGGIPAANRNQSPAQNGQGDQNGDYVGQPKSGAAAGSLTGSGGDQGSSSTSSSSSSSSSSSQSSSSQGDVSGSGANS